MKKPLTQYEAYMRNVWFAGVYDPGKPFDPLDYGWNPALGVCLGFLWFVLFNLLTGGCWPGDRSNIDG